MRSALLLASALSLFLGSTSAQGFASNCTASQVGWDGTYASMFVAECPDHAGNSHASFIPISDCVTNSEGSLKGQQG